MLISDLQHSIRAAKDELDSVRNDICEAHRELDSVLSEESAQRDALKQAKSEVL